MNIIGLLFFTTQYTFIVGRIMHGKQTVQELSPGKTKDVDYINNQGNFDISTWAHLIRCFQCLICGDYTFTQMQQCYRSHLFCNPCFNSWTKYPICNMKKSKMRSSKNETICSLLVFPCKYSYKGGYLLQNACFKNNSFWLA